VSAGAFLVNVLVVFAAVSVFVLLTAALIVALVRRFRNAHMSA
jgi:hypothetical protein